MNINELKQAFAAGFMKGRKVMFFYGQADLDARAEKAFNEWLNNMCKKPCSGCMKCWQTIP